MANLQLHPKRRRLTSGTGRAAPAMPAAAGAATPAPSSSPPGSASSAFRISAVLARNSCNRCKIGVFLRWAVKLHQTLAHLC